MCCEVGPSAVAVGCLRGGRHAAQALEHPFLKRGGRAASDGAVAVGDTPQKGAHAMPPAAAAAAAGAAASGEQRQQAAAVKETDRLQVDGGTVHNTLQAERWRELITVICQVRRRNCLPPPSAMLCVCTNQVPQPCIRPVRQKLSSVWGGAGLGELDRARGLECR